MSSAVGRKVIVATTGLCLLFFLGVHVLGNLPFLASSPEAELTLNRYAAWLSQWAVISIAGWATLALFGAHALVSLQLTAQSRAARGAVRAQRVKLGSFQSLTMPATGVVLAAFLALHLADFWYPYQFSESLGVDAAGNRELYSLVRKTLSGPGRGAIYLTGMLALVLHLSHGVFSAFRTIGVTSPRAISWSKRASWLVAIVLSGAFSVMILRQLWSECSL